MAGREYSVKKRLISTIQKEKVNQHHIKNLIQAQYAVFKKTDFSYKDDAYTLLLKI